MKQCIQTTHTPDEERLFVLNFLHFSSLFRKYFTNFSLSSHAAQLAADFQQLFQAFYTIFTGKLVKKSRQQKCYISFVDKTLMRMNGIVHAVCDVNERLDSWPSVQIKFTMTAIPVRKAGNS